MAIDPKNFPMPSESAEDEMLDEEGMDLEVEEDMEEMPNPMAELTDEEIMEEAKKRGLV